MFKEIRVGYERSKYTLQSQMKLTFITFDNFEVNVFDVESDSTPSVDPTIRLKELKDLYEDDCISEEEYQALKAKVLKDLK